jgi:hypothetical protein
MEAVAGVLFCGITNAAVPLDFRSGTLDKPPLWYLHNPGLEPRNIVEGGRSDRDKDGVR